MRVCHVVEAAGGGSGQVVIDLAQWGVAHGDQVTIVHPTTPRATEQFLGALKTTPEVRLIGTPMQRGVGLHDLIDAVKLYFCLRRAGPFDIINAQSSKAGGLVRLIGFLFPDAVIVYTPHAFQTMAQGASLLYVWIEKLLSRMCTMIICVSAQEHQHAREHLKIPEEQLRTIVNGIRLDYPADRAGARQKMGANDTCYVVGFIGRLVQQKNPARLVAAFAAAAQRHSNMHLVIVGDGELRAETERQLAAHKLLDQTHFLSSSYARDYIPGFDCLLCSSDFESFGLVLVEALAAGVPIVTTPVGIAEDAVVNGETGFMAPDFAPETLGEHLVRLASLDQAARTAMSRACKARAQQWGIDPMAQQTEDLYLELLTRRNGKS